MQIIYLYLLIKFHHEVFLSRVNPLPPRHDPVFDLKKTEQLQETKLTKTKILLYE